MRKGTLLRPVIQRRMTSTATIFPILIRKVIEADAKGKAEYSGYLGTPSGKILEYDPETKEDTELK